MKEAFFDLPVFSWDAQRGVGRDHVRDAGCGHENVEATASLHVESYDFLICRVFRWSHFFDGILLF